MYWFGAVAITLTLRSDAATDGVGEPGFTLPTFQLSLAFTYGIKGAVFEIEGEDKDKLCGGAPRRVAALAAMRADPSLVTFDAGGYYFGGTNAVLFPSNQGGASAVFFG